MSNHARSLVGTAGVAESFLRGAKNFQTMSNGFQLCPTDFSRGAKRFAGETLHPFPLVTGLCPIVSKYVQHIFPGGPKIFLTSYGPGFAP